jgi:DNA replication and repair protein RecF
VRLDWLELEGFRSYRHLEFRPGAGVNLLMGENGSGKTNLLEAINYLSALRSFRRAPEDALLADGEETAVIRGGVTGPVSEHQIEVLLRRRERRRVQVDGKRPRRNADILDTLRCVTFLPDDLHLVKSSAGARRSFLDELAGQLRPAATANQGEYDRALRQRNALLRQDGHQADLDALAGFEAQLASSGARVFLDRRETIDSLGKYLREAYARLGSENLSWSYESKWALSRDDEAELVQALAANLESDRRRDMDRRMTTVGPHRDEPSLLLDSFDSRTHASQGEQRSIVLALRLATFDLLADRFDDPPVLILDDVFSELDPTRAEAVAERLPGAQAFLTTARLEEVVDLAGTRWALSEGGMVVEQ